MYFGVIMASCVGVMLAGHYYPIFFINNTGCFFINCYISDASSLQEKKRQSRMDCSTTYWAINNGRSVREVARSFAIPRSTLQIQIKQNDTSEASRSKFGIFKTRRKSFSRASNKFGKTFLWDNPTEIKKCAYKYAEEKQLLHPFSTEKETEGRDWLTGFLKRNPTIRLRKTGSDKH